MSIEVGHKYRLKHGANPVFRVRKIETQMGWGRKRARQIKSDFIIFDDGTEVNRLFFDRHYELVKEEEEPC